MNCSMENDIVSEILCKNCRRYKIVYKSRFLSLFKQLELDGTLRKLPNFSQPNVNQPDAIRASLKKDEKNNESNAEKQGFNEEDEKNVEINSKIKDSNEIQLEEIFNGSNSKTTAVIKNIPKKFEMKDLLEVLNENEVTNFDIVYLPIKSKGSNNKKNLGFAFINFIDVQNLAYFYMKLHHKFNGILTSQNCRKYYEVFYCNTQGFDKIKKCYSNKYLYFNKEAITHI